MNNREYEAAEREMDIYIERIEKLEKQKWSKSIIIKLLVIIEGERYEQEGSFNNFHPFSFTSTDFILSIVAQ